MAKGASAGAPPAAMVKVWTNRPPEASKISMLTAASKTRARPEIETGLVTRCPAAGAFTIIEGSAGLVGLGFGGQAPEPGAGDGAGAG